MPTNVESQELPGISQALVDADEKLHLMSLIHPRSGGPYAFIYDRGNGGVFDGSNLTAPLPCSRHTAIYPAARRPFDVDQAAVFAIEDRMPPPPSARKNWLAVACVQEEITADGSKWRTVDFDTLPDVIKVAGSEL
jgi:hypothetical protein